MNGKLRTFGLALVAAFALGAVAAAGASAEGAYTFESSHTTIEGSQSEVSEFETAVGTVKCQNATFAGTVEGKEASDLTITPTYSGCVAFGVNATIDMNGCKYTFSTPTETGQNPPADFHAEVQIVNCTKAIEVTTAVCTVKIPEQTPTTPTVDLTNTGTGPMKALVTPTVQGMSYSYSGICGSGSASNGAYRGSVATQGFVAFDGAWFSIKRVGGTATEGAKGKCEFTVAGQTCQVQFKNITARTLRVLSIKLIGPKPTERYNKLKENCVFNLAFGECTDELEAAQFEAGAVNDYCMTVEDKGTKAIQHACGVLVML